MKNFKASAPGKIILFGEHAVVYNRPAIAIPVHQVQAVATIDQANPEFPHDIWLDAPQIGIQGRLDLSSSQPIAVLLRLFQEALHLDALPGFTIALSSTIPLASGMGSGAAISVAILRGLLGSFELSLPPEQINLLTYQIEKIYHGTPSGIDNTVITYEQPIYFVRGQPLQKVHLGQEFTLVIADSGITSTTLEVVTDVRKGWQEEPAAFESYFDQIRSIVLEARQILERGPVESLGPLMNANQAILKKMGVSCPKLDYLLDAALFAGAWGSKLSGGGRGGNIIALVNPDQAADVASALVQAGARSTIITTESPANVSISHGQPVLP